MSESSSIRILNLIDRLRSGDGMAADELLRSVKQRLEVLARKMLSSFPKVQRHAEADDILQGAAIRLLNSLRELRPGSGREFFNLAAMQIRRELLDLSRRCSVRLPVGQTDEESPEPPDPAPPTEELDRWAQFHRAVEKLPIEERETIGLVFYHGKTRAEAAEILGVSERTIQRWWQSACELLKDRLGSDLTGP